MLMMYVSCTPLKIECCVAQGVRVRLWLAVLLDEMIYTGSSYTKTVLRRGEV